MQTESNEVLYDVADHITVITLNAPERLNTMSGPMQNDLTRLLIRANHGGLANEVVTDVALMARAREIAANAPLAVQVAKRMMRMGLNETFPDHVHHVYLQLLPLFKTQDMQEGITAFMEKREPKFEGR